MSNIPTVTDKTTLNPSPPNDPPQEPVSPSSDLYPRLGRDLLDPYEQLTETFRTLALQDITETASTGSSSSVDSAKQSDLDFSTSGVSTKEQINLRREFLKRWYESVRLEKRYLETTEKARTRRVDPELEDLKVKRAEAHNETLNSLNQYAYAVVKNKLEPESPNQATQESSIRFEQDLKEYVAKTGGDEKLVNVLVQHLTQVHGKQLEFGRNVLLILQREALDQNAKSRIANKKLTRDYQQLQKLSERRIEKAKNHLLNDLIASQERAISLNKIVAAQEDSQSSLLVDIDSLQRALANRDEHIKLITQGSNEANSQLLDELNQSRTETGVAQSRVTKLQDQLRKQSEELDSKTATHKELIADKAKLSTDLRNTQKSLNEQKEAERQLRYELDDTKKHLDEAITTAKRWEQTFKDRTQQYKAAEESFDRKTDLYNLDVTNLKQRLLSTTTHNTSLESANQSLHSELQLSDKTDQLVIKLRERTEDQDKQISELIDNLDAVKSELEQATERNTELRNENILLHSKVTNGSSVNTALEESVSKLTIQLTQSLSTNSGLDQQVKDLFDTITVNESRIRDLQDELATLNDPSIHDPSEPTPRRRLNFNNTTFISPTRPNSPLRLQSPIRTQTPLRMPGSTDGTNNAGQAQAPDIATPLVQKLGELFSREEKKTIPTYKGKTSDKPVTDWLKTAERVAQNNNWDPAQKIRFFSDRLGGEAIDWHTTYVIAQGANIRYEDWKKEFIKRFRNESDVEKLKNKLHILKQKPEQRTRAFVAKLNDLYDSIHGKERAAPSAPANVETVALYHDVLKFRNDEKKKILMKGLLPNIKTELWPRILPNDTYEQLCEHAYTAEAIVINKDLCEDKGLTAVIAGMSHHEKEQDKEIEFLRHKLDRIATINDTPPKQESQNQDHTIAVADRYPPRRSFSGDRRPSRSDNRVQFRPPTPQRSNSFSRAQGTGNHFSSSRTNSLERFPSNHSAPENRLGNRSFNRSDSPRPFSSNRTPFVQRPISPARPPLSEINYNRSPPHNTINNPNTGVIRPYQNTNPRYNNITGQQTIPPNRFTRSGANYTPRFQRNGQRTITCYKCGYRGHIAKECRTPLYRPSYQPKRN